MLPKTKLVVTFLSFILALLIIACMCSPKLMPSTQWSGLEGTWHNPVSGDVYEIASKNGGYVVVSCTFQGELYPIRSQSWSGSSLRWTYYDAYYDHTITVTTVSLDEDNLEVKLDNSDEPGESATLFRGDIPLEGEATVTYSK